MIFTGLLFGLNQIGQQPFWSWQVAGALIIGIVALILLIIRSQHLTNPMINFQVFRQLQFSGYLGAFLIIQLMTLGQSFILPTYIQLVNQQTAIVAGLAVLPGAVIAAALSPISGRILDKFGARRPILIGMSLIVLALLVFVLTSMQLTSTRITLIGLLYMTVIGLGAGNVMTSALQSLPNDLQTNGNAVLTTLQQFAGAVGTSLVSTIIGQSQLAYSKTSLNISTAIGTQRAFEALFILAIVALVLLIIVLRPKSKQPTSK